MSRAPKLQVDRGFEPAVWNEPDERDTLIEILPKAQDYLVAIAYGAQRVNRIIWDTHEDLKLDFPTHYLLSKTGQTIVVRSAYNQQEIILEISQAMIDQGAKIQLPPIEGVSTASPIIRITRLKRNRAAFMSAVDAKKHAFMHQATDLYITHGYRDSLESFDAFLGPFAAKYENKKIFTLDKMAGGAKIKAKVDGLELQIRGKEPSLLPKGVSATLSESDLQFAIVRKDEIWWRINRLANPPVPAIDQAIGRTDPEEALFKKLTHIAGFVFVAVILAFYFNPSPVEISLTPPKPKVVEPPVVQLKKPKVLPKKPETKKPELKKPEPPKPKPEPPKKKPEPPKQIKKPEPIKKKPLPPAPRPKPIIAKPTPKPIKPPPAPVLKPVPKAPPVAVATAPKAPPPPKTPPKPAVVQPTPEQIRAAQQAKLAKSLGFLSAAPNKLSKNPTPFVNEANPDAKYQAVSSASPVAGKTANNALTTMAGAQTSGGPIDTKSSRIVSGETGVVGGQGKGLNEVQGKVSLNALYDPNSGDSLGSSLGGQGLTMSGQGQISEALLMKVLQKYLHRFQYCYEKALLTNAALAGTLTMQWTIQPGGKATDITVIKSQLNNSGLHGCMTKELSKIPFPSPSGGSVTIKYPFSFSASAL